MEITAGVVVIHALGTIFKTNITTMEKAIEILVEIVVFLTASYFIFYRSYLNALGREVAKLSTTKELTLITEGVKKDFNEKLENYKSTLNELLSKNIESLKSELAKNNISYQIQYSFLHQERAKATLKIYRKLQELHFAFADWTATIHPIIEDSEKEEEQRRIRVNLAINDFRSYYVSNKLFFVNSFCTYIDTVFDEYWKIGWEFGFKQGQIKSRGLSKEYQNNYIDGMNKISHEIRDNFPLKIKQIENQCRKILKVEEE